jgi:hypothetical protein
MNVNVTLIGGPLDGWPLVIRGDLPEELRLPYTREMLQLAAESSGMDKAALRERWRAVTFPSETEADGIALYRRTADAVQPRFHFAGHGAPC